MSYSNFKYCPFCGSQIQQNNMVKYCSFCGSNLLLKGSLNQDNELVEQIIVHDELPQKQIAVDDKEQIEINIATYNAMRAGEFTPSEYYSIILKYASSKQSLVSKLEKVLLRGSFAIRLAVDNIPSVIIYKAKGKDIRSFSRIFIEEQASISIVPGDFNGSPTLEELFNTFDTLGMQTRQIIENIPINLWLGDTIHGVFPHAYRENQDGPMVISDKNIYFIYQDIYTKQYRWFVISYNLLLKIGIQDNSLELTYKDSKVANIAFRDKLELSNAYQCIGHIVQSFK